MASKKKPKVIITPDYLLRGRAKTIYQYGSLANKTKLEVYNMYDLEHVKTPEELKGWNFEDVKKYLTVLYSKYTVKELVKAFNFKHHYKLYKLLDTYNVERKSLSLSQEQDNKKQKVDAEETALKNSFSMKFNGVFKGQEISDKLMTLMELIDKSKNYKVFISFDEGVDK